MVGGFWQGWRERNAGDQCAPILVSCGLVPLVRASGHLRNIYYNYNNQKDHLSFWDSQSSKIIICFLSLYSLTFIASIIISMHCIFILCPRLSFYTSVPPLHYYRVFHCYIIQSMCGLAMDSVFDM